MTLTVAAAAAMAGETRFRVLLRQRPLQLLLITKRPSVEREFLIEPQQEDYS